MPDMREHSATLRGCSDTRWLLLAIRYPAIGPGWRDGMQFDQLTRREVMSLLGGAAAWPPAARAQQSGDAVIGILSSGSPNAFFDDHWISSAPVAPSRPIPSGLRANPAPVRGTPMAAKAASRAAADMRRVTVLLAPPCPGIVAQTGADGRAARAGGTAAEARSSLPANMDWREEGTGNL